MEPQCLAEMVDPTSRRAGSLVAVVVIHVCALLAGCTGGPGTHDEAMLGALPETLAEQGVQPGTEAAVEEGVFVSIKPIAVAGPALRVMGQKLVATIMKMPESHRRTTMELMDDMSYWRVELGLAVAGTDWAVEKVARRLRTMKGIELRATEDGPSCVCPPRLWQAPSTHGPDYPAPFDSIMPVAPPPVSLSRTDRSTVVVCRIIVAVCDPDDCSHGSMPRGFVRVPVIDAALPRP